MRKRQQFPHRIQSLVTDETFKIISRAQKKADATQAEAVRHYIELGILAEQRNREVTRNSDNP